MVEPSDIDASAILRTDLPIGVVQLPGSTTDARLQVFLSYSRKDLVTAEHLRDVLIARGFGAYLDKHDILPGEPWKERLAQLIETADTVVFLISPDSIASTVCDWEVNEAERLGKRILPVVIRDAPADAVPGRLKRLNYIFLRHETEAADGLARLEAALLTDIAWVREHTRLGERAAEWERKTRADALLLRGSELAAAELWVSRAHSGDQAPTDLHRAYITASREAEQARTEADRVQVARTRRFQKRAMWALMGVAVLLVAGLAGVIWQDIETTKREQAVFTKLAAQAMDEEQFDRAMRYALYAYPAKGTWPWTPVSPELEGRLGVAAMASRLRATFRHPGEVTVTAAFSPDGRHAISAGGSFPDKGSNTARVWDTVKRLEVAALRGHFGIIRVATFASDGRLALTSSDDGTARLWDVASGRQLRSLNHDSAVEVAAFSPDGATVITASSRVGYVWSVPDGSLLRRLEGHSDNILAMAFDPDGSAIVSASRDDDARVWDLRTGAQRSVLRGHLFGVTAVVWSANGKLIATGAGDETARIWDAQTGRELFHLKGHRGKLTKLAFGTDGKVLVTVAEDGTLRVWNVEDGTLVFERAGHKGPVRDLAISPDGRHIATASDDGDGRLWDVRTGGAVARFAAHLGRVRRVAFDSDGQQLATAGDDGTIRIWTTEQSRSIELVGHTNAINSVRFDTTGHRVVTASADKSARRWDPATGVQILPPLAHEASVEAAAPLDDGGVVTVSGPAAVTVWQQYSRSQINGTAEVKEAEAPVVAAISNDARWVFAASRTIGARLHNVLSGSVQSVEIVGADVRAAYFSQDGTVLLIVAGERSFVLDVDSGRLRSTLSGHYPSDPPGQSTDKGRAGHFSPGGGLTVTASNNGARVWDIETGTPQYDLVGHKAIVRSARFSPDGRWIVTATGTSDPDDGRADITARIWSGKNGQLVASLAGHEKTISDASFSQDGKKIVTVSHDDSIRFWDVPSGSELGSLRFRGLSALAVSWSTDGERFATYGHSHVARIWDASWLVRNGEALRRSVCLARLQGSEQFTDAELNDPTLRHVPHADAVARNPCQRRGPLSWEYWSRALQRLLPAALPAR